MSAAGLCTTSKFMQKTPGSCGNRRQNLRSEVESAGRKRDPHPAAENEGYDEGVTR
jgi:hypothetical protein